MEKNKNKMKKWVYAAALGTAISFSGVAMIRVTPLATQAAQGNVKEVQATPGNSAKELQALLDANANGEYDALIVKIPKRHLRIEHYTLHIIQHHHPR